MPRPFSAMHRHDFCLACNVCKMYLMSNVNAPQNNWWLMITKRGQTFSDIKVWALRIIAGIALIVIGTICLPKIWSQLKNSFSEISTARKRNPRRGKMQGRVKVWKTCAPFLATHIKTEKGAIYWKKIQILIIVRQMKDTTRVDQRPRKWSVNPQHKLETRFSHNYEI